MLGYNQELKAMDWEIRICNESIDLLTVTEMAEQTLAIM